MMFFERSVLRDYLPEALWQLRSYFICWQRSGLRRETVKVFNCFLTQLHWQKCLATFPIRHHNCTEFLTMENNCYLVKHPLKWSRLQLSVSSTWLNNIKFITIYYTGKNNNKVLQLETSPERNWPFQVKGWMLSFMNVKVLKSHLIPFVYSLCQCALWGFLIIILGEVGGLIRLLMKLLRILKKMFNFLNVK